MRVNLRPQIDDDLPLLTGGASPFDDFGPRAPRTQLAPSNLREHGALSVIAEGGKLLGYVTWHWRAWGPNPDSHCPMIGIWLREEHRGRGAGTSAQRELVDLFFKHTSCNRVEAHTDIANLAEQKALAAAGFTNEGVIRGAQWRDGQFRDGILYSILRSEYETGHNHSRDPVEPELESRSM